MNRRLLLSALLLTACGAPVSPSAPPTLPPISAAPATTGQSLGLFEITFIGGGGRPLSVQATRVGGGAGPQVLTGQSLTGQSLSERTGIVLTPVSKGTFDLSGKRNVQATFGVGVGASPVGNLTFLAVATPDTISGTPIRSDKFTTFDGSAAPTAIASMTTPSQPKSLDGDGSVVNQNGALFQVFTEAEVSETAFPRPAGVSDVFPYGFVARASGSGARTLAANSTDGRVTFSFDLPLQANIKDNPFSLSVMVDAVADDVPALTQGLEQLDAANAALVAGRFRSLQAMNPAVPAMLRKMGGCAAGVGTVPLVQHVPTVRTAGSVAAPVTVLGSAPASPVLSLRSVVPAPFTRGASFVPPTQTFAATFDQALSNPGAVIWRSAQSGRRGAGVSYQPGGLLAGEELEVTVGSGLRGAVDNAAPCAPAVFRYRVQTAPERAAGFTAVKGGGYANSAQLGVTSTVSLADVTGDGKLDLILVDGSVVVFRGAGNGTFSSPRTYLSSGKDNLYASAAAPGQVDRTGNVSIVTANGSANSVSVLTGSTRFNSYPVGTAPAAVTLGDLNGDGKLDLVTANSGSNDVSVLLGLLGPGDGTFGAQTPYRVGTAPAAVTLGDLNGDGKLDLVTANSGSNDVSVLLGQGDGTFGVQTPYRVGIAPVSVALGDLNGDGFLDLVTANTDSGDVSVLLGRGDGTLGAPVTYAGGVQPGSVVLGDVNGDGKLDIVTTTFDSSGGLVLSGQGDGTFRAPVSSGVASLFAALGDVNGDGRLDLVTPNGVGLKN
ncbi:FG-GAP repeat domain-containing protein [Deinococcus altitudinis]|uniref:FG-GAP repeat domain-containing protein n=1 Tax=Deinococcus altitudinis TaxID=468914 RepID=UPI0038919512